MSKKKHKAANGSGTIIRRKNGKFEARLWIILANGTRKRLSQYAKTWHECNAWLLEMRHRQQNGEVVCEAELTVIEWLRTWLELFCADIRSSTRTSYEAAINRHIAAHPIANLKLKALSANHIQQFILFLGEQGRLDGRGGLSPKTIRNIYLVLHSALKQARQNGLIRTNPAEFVKLPKVRQEEIRPLTNEEIERLLDAVKGERWAVGMHLLLHAGLRIGELLGLRHSSIREENGITYLHIDKAVKRITNPKKHEGAPNTVLILDEPKTETSKRDVPLIPEVAARLREHLAQQREKAEQSFGLYADDAFIIGNELGAMTDPTTLRKWFKKMTKQAGITRNVRVHDTRHTFASQCLKNGMSMKYISTLLGHSSETISARVYTHTDLEGTYEALCKMHSNQ